MGIVSSRTPSPSLSKYRCSRSNSMAARGAGVDPRDLTNEEHLRAWLDRTDNRGVGFESPSMGKEAMKGRKVPLSEVFKVYELDDVYFSTDLRITKLNQEIVKKVNSLVVQCVEFIKYSVVGHESLSEESADKEHSE